MLRPKILPVLLLFPVILCGCSSGGGGSSEGGPEVDLLDELNSFNYDYVSYLDTPGQMSETLSNLWDGRMAGYSAYEVETEALSESVYYHGYCRDEDLATLQNGVSSLIFSPGMDIKESLSNIDGKLVLVASSLNMQSSLKWAESANQVPEKKDGYTSIARLKEERIFVSFDLTDGESLSLEYPYLRLCPYSEGKAEDEISAFEESSYLCLGLDDDLVRKSFSAPCLLRPDYNYASLQSKAELVTYDGKDCLKTRIKASYEGTEYNLLGSSDIPSAIDDFGSKKSDFSSCLVAEDGNEGYFDYAKVKELIYGI